MTTIRAKIYRLLRRSEKYIKTDVVYLAKGGFWVTFGRSINTLLSLGLIVAFANLLPKETYGLYQYILSLAGILNIFTLTGMNSAVARSVARGHDAVLKHTVNYQLKWNLLMFGAFIALALYYFLNSDSVMATAFVILSIFVPATFAFNTYGAFLEGRKKFKFAHIASSISTAVYAIGMIVTMFLSGDVLLLIFVYAGTTFFMTLFFYLLILSKHKIEDKEGDDAEVADVKKYGKKLTFVRFSGPITSQIDKVVLTHFWGPVELAIYALALALPNRVTPLLKNWVGIGLPKFANKSIREINTVFYRRLFQSMSLGLFVTILYVLAAPYIFTYILPQYVEGILYSQIIALSFIFAMPNRYISLLYESQKLSREMFKNVIINSSVSISLFVYLGITSGIKGLAIAQVLAAGLGALVNVTMWRRYSAKVGALN